jgi:hypothetical protein
LVNERVGVEDVGGRFFEPARLSFGEEVELTPVLDA